VISQQRPDLVITHSMANSVVAAGVIKGLPGCDLIGKNPNDIHWYGLQGPFKGTEGGSIVIEYCKNPDQDRFKSTPMLVSYYIKKSYCNGEVPYPAYISMRPDFVNTGTAGSVVPQYQCPAGSDSTTCKTLIDAADGKMKGNMCGLSQSPVHSSSPPLMETLAANVLSSLSALVGADYGDDQTTDIQNQKGNDGLVPSHSCKLPSSTYTGNPNDISYIGMINHKDGTSYFGDGDDDSQKPLTYVLGRVADSLAIKNPVPPTTLQSPPDSLFSSDDLTARAAQTADLEKIRSLLVTAQDNNKKIEEMTQNGYIPDLSTGVKLQSFRQIADRTLRGKIVQHTALQRM